jgi:hypothetical protein
VEHLKIPAVRSKGHHHNRQRRVVVRTTVDVEAGFRREAADPALVLVPFNFQKAHGPGRPPHIPLSTALVLMSQTVA